MLSGRLRDIPLPECLELVARRPVVRIGYCFVSGPGWCRGSQVLIDAAFSCPARRSQTAAASLRGGAGEPG